MNKNTLILFMIVVVVIGAVLGLAVYLKSVSPEKVLPNPNIVGEKILVRPTSHMTGNINAKVTLVEFGDYQCPFCGEAYPIVKAVTDKYGKNTDFNFVFRNFPLAQHPNADEAAEAAEAAGAEGKYFEMHDLLYSKQNDWSGSINPSDLFTSYAGQLDLDVNRFHTDFLASKFVDTITQDEKDGDALGVNSTPTFFLNGVKLDSYIGLDDKVGLLLAK